MYSVLACDITRKAMSSLFSLIAVNQSVATVIDSNVCKTIIKPHTLQTSILPLSFA